MSEDPLFWIHLNVDYPFNLTGVLYFPRVKSEFELQRNKIKLYSRQVFITDEVKDIVPDFLMLLHGVIDSPDIPLNVSRSFLQADGAVKKIGAYITRKVADKLAELFKNDRKSYAEKWADIGLFVKYGCITDAKFAEKAKEFLLLQNTKGEHYTLGEYHEKTAPLQTDKNGTLIYLYTPDADKQHAYIAAAEKRGYDVLLMNSPIDNHFISFLEQQTEKTALKRVDADVMDKLIEKEAPIEMVLNEAQQAEIKEIFTKAAATPGMEVSVESLSPDELPVTVTMDEWMRRMKDMASLGGGAGMGFYGALPDRYKVAVNGNHPLIQRILGAENGQKEALALQAFDLALLSQGMLSGQALTDFVARSIHLI